EEYKTEAELIIKNLDDEGLKRAIDGLKGRGIEDYKVELLSKPVEDQRRGLIDHYDYISPEDLLESLNTRGLSAYVDESKTLTAEDKSKIKANLRKIHLEETAEEMAGLPEIEEIKYILPKNLSKGAWEIETPEGKFNLLDVLYDVVKKLEDKYEMVLAIAGSPTYFYQSSGKINFSSKFIDDLDLQLISLKAIDDEGRERLMRKFLKGLGDSLRDIGLRISLGKDWLVIKNLVVEEGEREMSVEPIVWTIDEYLSPEKLELYPHGDTYLGGKKGIEKVEERLRGLPEEREIRKKSAKAIIEDAKKWAERRPPDYMKACKLLARAAWILESDIRDEIWDHFLRGEINREFYEEELSKVQRTLSEERARLPEIKLGTMPFVRHWDDVHKIAIKRGETISFFPYSKERQEEEFGRDYPEIRDFGVEFLKQYASEEDVWLNIGGSFSVPFWRLKQKIHKGRAWNIDISKIAVEEANRKGIDSVVGDIQELRKYLPRGIKPGEVSVIVSAFVFEYLENPEKAFKEIYETLREGGIAVLRFHHPENYVMKRMTERIRIIREMLERHPPSEEEKQKVLDTLFVWGTCLKNVSPPEKWISMLEKIGFRVLQKKEIEISRIRNGIEQPPEKIFTGIVIQKPSEKAELPKIGPEIIKARDEAEEILSGLDKAENREKLVEILNELTRKIGTSEITQEMLEGARYLKEQKRKVKEKYGADVLIGTVLIPLDKWSEYYGVTKDGEKVYIGMTKEELEEKFREMWKCSLEEGIKRGRMIRINRKKCRVVKGAGLVTRLGKPPSFYGINFHPTKFKHPFDKVSLRLLAELPGRRIILHEDLHGAYLMHKYLTGKWRPRKRLLSLDQYLIDEINAYRDDVNTRRVTWEKIKDGFENHYVPEVSRKYNLSGIETEKLLELSKKAIDIVAELQKRVPESKITEILFNNDTLEDVIKAGLEEIERSEEKPEGFVLTREQFRRLARTIEEDPIKNLGAFEIIFSTRREVRERFGEEIDQWLVRMTQRLKERGKILSEQRDDREAAKCAEILARIFGELGDKENEARNYHLSGSIYRELREFEKSAEYGEISGRIYEELGKKENAAESYALTAYCYEKTEQPRKAIEFYKKAASLYEELGDIDSASETYERMAKCYEILLEFQEARECDEKAMRLRESQRFGGPQPGGIPIQTPEQIRNLRERQRELSVEELRKEITPEFLWRWVFPNLVEERSREVKTEWKRWMIEVLMKYYREFQKECEKRVKDAISRIKEHRKELMELWGQIKKLDEFINAYTTSSIQREILRTIVIFGLNRFSPGDIEELTEISGRTVRNALFRLVEKRVLVRPGRFLKGHYLLSVEFIDRLYKSEIINEEKRKKLITDLKIESIYDEFERNTGVRLEASYRNVLSFIIDNRLNCFGVERIAKLSGIPMETIRQAFRKSVNMGILTRVVNNRYLLSEKFIKQLHESEIVDDSTRDRLILDLKREHVYDEFRKSDGSKLEPTFREILNLILDKGLNRFGIKKIAEVSGFPTTSIYHALHDFVDAKVLIKPVRDRYLLSERFINRLHESGIIDDSERNKLILDQRIENLYDRLKREKHIRLDARFREILDIILVHSKEVVTFTPKEIIELSGILKGTVNDALRNFIKGNILKRPRHGVYSLSDEFRSELRKISIGGVDAVTLARAIENSGVITKIK
ncbi:MAG: hypothetical protein DRO89_05125, partial [Candidatus Altiarchaeales archaeon]